MRRTHLLTGLAAALLTSAVSQAGVNDLLITEIVDGTLPGGQPKWVELTNTGSTDLDMTQFSFGNYNNGSTNLGGGASSVLTGTLPAGGSYIVAYDADNGPGMSVFFGVYGFDPDFYMGGGFVNGDDALALFLGPATGDGSDATLLDVYGEIGVDGSGTPWEYLDSWAARCVSTPNGGVFDLGEWVVGGADALEQGCGFDDVCEEANLLALTNPLVYPDSKCLAVPFCFAHENPTTGGPCPCGNTAGPGEGCANSSGSGGVLTASGSASVSAGDLVLHGTNIPNFGLFFQGAAPVNNGDGDPFGDGLRCANSTEVRLETLPPGPAGGMSTTVDVAAIGGVMPGDTGYYQLWYRDPAGPCTTTFNLTNALAITWTN